MERTDRAAEIEAAAYRVLEERGFKGASMLAIAKEAKASNETLYNWYGNKTGLFAAMIARNADRVVETLQTVKATNQRPYSALLEVSRSLLSMVTSNEAVALNRAAAGDLTGNLGRLLAKEGRGRIAPLISKLLIEVVDDADDVADLTDCYLSLLIGDLQIKRATGAIEQPDEGYIARRAETALVRIRHIYGSHD